MTISMGSIEAVVAVARLGRFTDAARSLNVCQSALSRRIGIAEATLGAPLFERDPAGARLTPAGAAFLPMAEAVLATLADGCEAVRGIVTAEGGELRVAFVDALCDLGLVEACQQFERICPGVALKLLSVGDSAEVSASVLDGRADIGLRFRTDPDARLSCREIGSEEIVVIAGGGHPLGRHSLIGLQDLSEATWIFNANSMMMEDDGLTAKLRQYGLASSHIISIASRSSQVSLIEAGFGIGLLARRSIASKLEDGSLICLPLDADIPSHVPVTLVTRRHGFQGRAAAEFERIVTEGVGID